jgi:hypothetical protein
VLAIASGDRGLSAKKTSHEGPFDAKNLFGLNCIARGGRKKPKATKATPAHAAIEMPPLSGTEAKSNSTREPPFAVSYRQNFSPGVSPAKRALNKNAVEQRRFLKEVEFPEPDSLGHGQ